MTLDDIIKTSILSALSLIGAKSTPEELIELLAIGLQESRLIYLLRLGGPTTQLPAV